MTPLLLNAARAFAMVGFADGKLAPAEAQRFAHMASHDPSLSHAGHADIADAWTQAAHEVHAAQSFGTALIAIRTEMTDAADKAVIMRVAQAAVIADGRLEAQENQAIFSLAEALDWTQRRIERHPADIPGTLVHSVRSRMWVDVEGFMRPRAGTHPVTLEPPTVAEILAIARQHDERLKDLQQDLFRAETKLRVERTLKWPIRVGCVAVGAGGLAIVQNEAIRAWISAFFADLFSNIRTTGLATLITLLVVGLVLFGIGWLVRKWIAGPTPEQKAKKLMEQFARADGVAAYVFAAHDTTEDEAATVDALVRPENKQMRQRRMTSSHRLLTSSLTRLLNQSADEAEKSRLRQLN